MKRLRKSVQNYLVFGSLFALGLLEAVSGFILWFALPRGTGRFGGGGGAEFWALSRHTWIDIHDWVAVAIMAVVIIHLALHWKWIVYTTKKMFLARQLAAQV